MPMVRMPSRSKGSIYDRSAIKRIPSEKIILELDLSIAEAAASVHRNLFISEKMKMGPKGLILFAINLLFKGSTIQSIGRTSHGELSDNGSIYGCGN